MYIYCVYVHVAFLGFLLFQGSWWRRTDFHPGTGTVVVHLGQLVRVHVLHVVEELEGVKSGRAGGRLSWERRRRQYFLICSHSIQFYVLKRRKSTIYIQILLLFPFAPLFSLSLSLFSETSNQAREKPRQAAFCIHSFVAAAPATATQLSFLLFFCLVVRSIPSFFSLCRAFFTTAVPSSTTTTTTTTRSAAATAATTTITIVFLSGKVKSYRTHIKSRGAHMRRRRKNPLLKLLLLLTGLCGLKVYS